MGVYPFIGSLTLTLTLIIMLGLGLKLLWSTADAADHSDFRPNPIIMFKVRVRVNHPMIGQSHYMANMLTLNIL
jgi:hypothetical protein